MFSQVFIYKGGGGGVYPVQVLFRQVLMGGGGGESSTFCSCRSCLGRSYHGKRLGYILCGQVLCRSC